MYKRQVKAGGPGALFWMWIAAFFGMATIYAEAVLAQLFKTKVDGEVTGGPAYYIRNGIKNEKVASFLAGFFAICCVPVSYTHLDVYKRQGISS